MNETRLTADLPDLRIEILRRELPEENAETMTIQVTAQPSFEAVGRHLVQHLMAPPAVPWANPLFNPMALWMQMARAAWSPLLGAMLPRLDPPRRD